MPIDAKIKSAAADAKKRDWKDAVAKEKNDAIAAAAKQCLTDLKSTGAKWFRTHEGLGALILNGRAEGVDRNTPRRLGAYLRSLGHNYDAATLALVVDDIAYSISNSSGASAFVRVGYRDSSIYVDLCNAEGQVVEIQPFHPFGWKLIEGIDCPIMFIRPPYAQALPLPIKTTGSQVKLLRDLLSLTDDAAWLKVLGFLLGCLRYQGSHYILPLMGASELGKSTLARLVSRVIDPVSPQIQQLRKKSEDTLLVASKRWVTCLDECDALNGEQAAMIAGIATGTGVQARSLYTDHEIATFSVRRPLILSGHGNLIPEKRILSRSLPITLTKRTAALSDSDLDQRFEEIAPEVLGALCTLAAGGLAFEGDPFPAADAVRMLEPAQWIEKCLQAGGLIQPGEFVRLARNDQDALNPRRAASNAPTAWCLAPSLLTVASKGFRGLASELLTDLGQCTGANVTAPGWPADAASLGKQLSTHLTEIKALGIELGKKQTKQGTEYTLSRSLASAAKPEEQSALDAHEKMRTDFAALYAVRPTASVIFTHPDGCCTLWGPFVADAAAQIGRETGEKAHLDLSAEEFASLNGLDSEVMFLEAS